jgi:RNA polymerase II subunit A small phosphatase-like protein
MLSCIFYFEFKCKGKPTINYVIIFMHIGLDEFLKELREFTELVLFTAGL